MRATSPAAARVNIEVTVERASSPAEKNSKKPPKSTQKVFSPPAYRRKQLQSIYAMWPRFCAANTVIVDSKATRVECNPEVNIVEGSMVQHRCLLTLACAAYLITCACVCRASHRKGRRKQSRQALRQRKAPHK